MLFRSTVNECGTAGLAPLVMLFIVKDNPQRIKEILEERLSQIQNIFADDTVHLILSVIVGKGAVGVGTVLIPFQENVSSLDLILLNEYQEKLQTILQPIRERQLLFEYNHVGRGENKAGSIYYFEPLVS